MFSLGSGVEQWVLVAVGSGAMGSGGVAFTSLPTYFWSSVYFAYTPTVF